MSLKYNNFRWLRDKIFISFSLFLLVVFFNHIYQNYQNLQFDSLKILAHYRFIFLAFFISIFYSELVLIKKFFIKFNFFLITFVLIDILIQKIFGTDLLGFKGGMCFGEYSYFDLKTLEKISTEEVLCQRFAGPFNQEFIAGSFIVFIGTSLLSLSF